MRILISTAGSHGDVLPFIAIGKEMISRGHEVFFYANPFFEKYVNETQIKFIPIGTTEMYHSLFGETTENNPTKSFKLVANQYFEICPKYYYAMKSDVIENETITISNSLLFASRLLKESDNIPSVIIHLAPSIFRSNINPPRLAAKWINSNSPHLMKVLYWWMIDQFLFEPYFTSPLNIFRKRINLPPVKNIFKAWIHEANFLFGMFPNWFANQISDWPDQAVLTGFPLFDNSSQDPLPENLIFFLKEGPPPICFTAGTASATAQQFFKESIEACRISGKRGILLAHFTDQIPAVLPANVIHVKYAPLGLLLPRVQIFVHHGGIGSASQALKAGVPQLIRPVAYDQFDNSMRCVALGVAKEILPKKYIGKNVAKILDEMASDQALLDCCKKASAQFSNNNPITNICDAIFK